MVFLNLVRTKSDDISYFLRHLYKELELYYYNVTLHTAWFLSRAYSGSMVVVWNNSTNCACFLQAPSLRILPPLRSTSDIDLFINPVSIR